MLVPFAFFSFFSAIASTFLIGILAMFILDRYVGKMSGESPLRTGLKFAALAMGGAVISYLIGDSLRHLSGGSIFS